MEKSCSDLSNSVDYQAKDILNDLSPQNNKAQLSKKTLKKKNSNVQTLIANLSQTKYAVVKKVLKNDLGFKITRQAEPKDWDLFWTDNAVQPEQLAKLKNYQKINHFPGMYSLSRKNYLTRNILKMAKEFPQEYNFYPKTWVLPSQLNQLRSHLQNEPSCVVIAKPQASSQGKGIFLTKNIDDFQFGQHYVVQRYLKKPLLIDKLKFDLRVYVLVAGCDPLRVYVYKEGLARFATEPYSVPKKQNMSNLFMHLTNYAINKLSQKYQFNECKTNMNKGHKRSLTGAFEHLKAQGHDTDSLWKEIKMIILKTIISVQPILAHHYKSCQSQNYSNNMCFEILGFDVIIDNQLKPSILEVNYTPSFATDTPLDKTIKENLIRESITLMNITQKAKNEAVNANKKALLERTLTGKKVWYSKQQRQEIVSAAQAKRDKWEDKHLGNFDKAFPFNQTVFQLSELQSAKQKYQSFLDYSQKTYHHNTGANIKRNTKVVNSAPSGLNKEQEKIIQETDFQKIKELRQAKLSVKTNELQKIYKTKFRPMLPNRNSNAKKQQMQQRSINSPSKVPLSKKDTIKETQFDQQITHRSINKNNIHTAVTIEDQKPNNTSIYKRTLQNQKKGSIQQIVEPNSSKNCYNSQINIGRKNYHDQTSKTANHIKIEGSVQTKNAIYNNKVVFRRPNSAVNRRGASTVYNLTFKKQLTNTKNQSLKTAKQLAFISQKQKRDKIIMGIKRNNF